MTPGPRDTSEPLVVDDLRVALDGKPVVRGVSLTARAGEFTVLLGSNGSGKTTLMRAATGLIPASGSEVRLFGTPVGQFGDWQRLGYVPQRSTAASGVPSTVREVVLTGRLSRHRFAGLFGREDRTAVAEAIEAVGLSAFTKAPAAELSGGQQQRVMIARGLASRPDLLVMDEPTAGVDAHSQEALATLFESLLDQGRSIFMIAHELGPFARLIDHAVVLHDGHVTYDGPGRPEDLLEAAEPHNQHHPHASDVATSSGIDSSGAWSA